MLSPPWQRLLGSRSERPYLPWIALSCLLLLLYLTSHRLDPSSLSSYGYPLSRLQSLPVPPPDRDDPAADSQLSLLSASTNSSRPLTPASLQALLLPRLNQLLETPILNYDDSLALESTRCPATYLQSNWDQLHGEGENWWPSVSVEELDEGRRNVIENVMERFGLEGKGQDLTEEGLKEMLGTKERGIVFTAGNQDTTSRLLSSLRILRRHGCALPVEIFAFPSELDSLGDLRRQIDELGDVTWRAIETKRREGQWKQFHIKGEAIARSSFNEILYLDSDNIAVYDPTFLFDSPLYKKHGIVLWPDFNRDSAANPIWRMLATPCDPTHWQAETGQVLVNKLARGGMNLVALEVARAMNARSEFWGHLSGGDKDTFRYAFYLLSLPFSLAPHYPSSAGGFMPASQTYKGHTFCGHTMLQYGLSPDEWELEGVKMLLGEQEEGDEKWREHAPPLFVHANLLKHSGFWNRRGSTFQSLKKPTDDRLFPLASSGTTSSSSRFASRPPLSSIRQTGLPVRGICVDVWDASARGGAGESRELDDSEGGEYEAGAGVEVVGWNEAYGGLLRGFEQMYFDEGGQAGGW
ncbi:hypothetical protein JCM5296_004566 [Sporobolomyces johnsonii]